jgi:hypothetical protein
MLEGSTMKKEKTSAEGDGENKISHRRCEIPSYNLRGQFGFEMHTQFSVVKPGWAFAIE